MGNEPPSNESIHTEQPASSLRVPFLSYIAKVLFSVSVFFIFLLVTWGLHYLGNTLGIVGTVSWGIFEILVISFGTLLCVLFFIKATAKFLPKLIRHLWKPIKQTDGIPFLLQPWDIAKSFVEPLHKQHRVLFGCSVLTTIVLLYVGISFAEIVRDDCDDASILACEMISETGPDFRKPIDSNQLETILGSYAKYMENKHLAGLLRIFSSYDPNKVFTATSETLSNAKGNQEEIANEIWRAGEEIMLFRLKSPKLLPRAMALHGYRKAPEWLLNDANDAIVESEKSSDLFDDTPTIENAVHSCEANRKTMLLLFLARASYNRPEVASLFTRFRVVVEACRRSKIDIAAVLSKDDPRKEFLEKIIAESEKRRLAIMDDIKNRDMQKVIDRMWDAIEIAYNRRAELLELCAKVRSAGNYSKNIVP